eukprot:CAMPEP_0202916040 /NCGR_PEP_ID=MMETSP1392-20130828/67463_1 /ASSEMBLY_ACC=CAM_ASM_000868 /TAXON_ID=225041 /ORGANISM="Chlamydomonas chlamydogama, Strain SAG 11-48b" /LENGTH=211 /DNA_ID=CAMNT_0049608299 /DNA_START=2058 /DNA_END=2694 /DNA_ORIENTATION=-
MALPGRQPAFEACAAAVGGVALRAVGSVPYVLQGAEEARPSSGQDRRRMRCSTPRADGRRCRGGDAAGALVEIGDSALLDVGWPGCHLWGVPAVYLLPCAGTCPATLSWWAVPEDGGRLPAAGASLQGIQQSGAGSGLWMHCHQQQAAQVVSSWWLKGGGWCQPPHAPRHGVLNMQGRQAWPMQVRPAHGCCLLRGLTRLSWRVNHVAGLA